MGSLLSKTLLLFVLCTATILVLTTPLFYLLTKHFYAEDMISIIRAVERGEGIPPLDLERDIMEGVMLQLILIFLVVSLSLFITIRFITRRLWQPFDDTLRKTEQFTPAHNILPQFLPTDITEFARLNRSLDSMMRKDMETFRIQKEFIENASHELQTPLAVVRSKLDLLMQENLTERQMLLVSDLYGLTTRMSHLNRNLLLLAKIDNTQYSDTEEVDIAALISESLPLYSMLRQEMPLHVDDCRTNRHIRLRANPTLLECLLKNLIVNAICHSKSDSGEVRILMEDSRLTVINGSDNGMPLDAAMLFRRFRRGNAQGQNGNGLGLAIVKAICDIHGWTVKYRFVDNKHRFVINFYKGY